MREWHCHIGGQQYGPVSDDGLRDWIRQGRVTPADLIWSAGMAEWAPAGTVPGFFLDGQVPPPPDPNSSVPMAVPGGTGGQALTGEITARARQALTGRWMLPVGFCLVLGILQSGGGVPYLGPIIGLIIAGPLQLGAAIFFLTFVRGGQPEFEMLFRGFKNFGNALGLHILMGIFVFLWMLLLIIPGIIAALSYSQAFYLMAQDSRLGPLDAIRASKEMMVGHKARLFVLGLRFIGWALLCILTLGIGFFWLSPYMQVSYATFHDDLCPPAGLEQTQLAQPPAGQAAPESAPAS